MKKISLDQFRLAKKRKACKVCELPAAVQRQLAGRSRHTAPLPVTLEWLKVVHEVSITVKEYMTHCRGGHPWKGALARSR